MSNWLSLGSEVTQKPEKIPPWLTYCRVKKHLTLSKTYTMTRSVETINDVIEETEPWHQLPWLTTPKGKIPLDNFPPGQFPDGLRTFLPRIIPILDNFNFSGRLSEVLSSFLGNVQENFPEWRCLPSTAVILLENKVKHCKWILHLVERSNRSAVVHSDIHNPLT